MHIWLSTTCSPGIPGRRPHIAHKCHVSALKYFGNQVDAQRVAGALEDVLQSPDTVFAHRDTPLVRAD